MITATLRCGTELSYEAPSLRPEPGDLVPCRRHGYCLVQVKGVPTSGGALSRRARPRAQTELMDWLQGRSEATVHALLRRGFTLRIVAAAEREGLVEVDLPAGRIAVRPALEAAPTLPAANMAPSPLCSSCDGARPDGDRGPEW